MKEPEVVEARLPGAADNYADLHVDAVALGIDDDATCVICRAVLPAGGPRCVRVVLPILDVGLAGEVRDGIDGPVVASIDRDVDEGARGFVHQAWCVDHGASPDLPRELATV